MKELSKSNKIKMKSNTPPLGHNKRMILSAALISIFLIAIAVFYVKYASKDFRTVAMVNGEPISSRELGQGMERSKSAIYQYFNRKYGLQDSKAFWTTEHNGEIPLVILKEKALKDCVQIKLQEILFKDYGIARDISYRAFLKDLNRENEERSKAIKNGKIIYGPENYNENVYFQYLLSDRLAKLKEKMGEKEFEISHDTLLDFYNENKDRNFKNRDMIRIQKVVFPFDDRYGNVNVTLKEEMMKKAHEAKIMLDGGRSFEEVAKIFNKEDMLQEQILSDASSKVDDYSPILTDKAEKLSTGEISDIFEENNCFYIVKCMEHKDMGYKTFDEVKGNIKTMLIDREFSDYIQNMVKKAVVEINSSVYDSIAVK